MLARAKAEPEKQGLEAYSTTIWELRRKGKTYREIAEFMKKGGVPTDHTAVYRFVRANGHPLLSSPEGAILLGDTVYESRPGRPLRPYEAGLYILAKRKLEIIPLKDAAPQPALWCEAQLQLSEAPNHDWLQKLADNMDLRWNPANPFHLPGRWGFELKFEGALLAMVCQTFNLDHHLQELGTAIYNTTKYFTQHKVRPYDMKELHDRRDVESLENLLVPPDASREEEIEESLEWNRGHAKQLTKQFHSITIPYTSD